MQPVQLIQGRIIGPADLALIRAWLAAHPAGNRTRPTRQTCFDDVRALTRCLPFANWEALMDSNFMMRGLEIGPYAKAF